MKRSGFTLIELSIVLVIIGLIIGGVMKGKDLINSAEQKKVYNTWVKGWQIAANTYEDRLGDILSDGTVNGGTQDTSDGHCDNVNLSNTTTVQDRLKEVGIDIPVSNISGTNGGAYNVKGKYYSGKAIAYLYYRKSDTDGTYKNRLYITGVPTDVAIAFDSMSDGTVNPSQGAFRRYQDDQTDGTDGTANTWPDASDTTTVNVMLDL